MPKKTPMIRKPRLGPAETLEILRELAAKARSEGTPEMEAALKEVCALFEAAEPQPPASSLVGTPASPHAGERRRPRRRLTRALIVKQAGEA